MKKLIKLILMVSVYLLGSTANAQLNGSTNIAPNFQKYDTDGVYHDLYSDYLDNGIPVVIDIMAYWCPPCWTYSNNGVLEDVYNQYGPNGTGEVMVFMADGDAGSTFPLLYGAAGSQGDWMSITGYPVFGGDTGVGADAGRDIANLYEITYFPTIYLIHPDRTVEEIGQVGSVSGIMSYVNNANPLSTSTNDVSLKYAYPMASICDGGEATFEYIMKNNSSTQMTSVTLDVEVDGIVMDTINWTGNLDSYDLTTETASATINGVSQGNHTLELIVKTVNDTIDEDASNNVISRTFSINETDKRYYTLKVQTDNAGNETNWFIRNGDDKIIYRRSDFHDGTYKNSTLYEHQLDLSEATCYKLVVTDSDGDGMAGYVNLKDEGNVTMAHVIVSETSAEASWKSTVISSVSELKNGNVSIYPNPVNGELNLNFNFSNDLNVSYRIINILGQTIENKTIGRIHGFNKISINTENFNGGVYIISIQIENENLIKRIIKK